MIKDPRRTSARPGAAQGGSHGGAGKENLFIRLSFNYSTELKLLFAALFILCSTFSLLQFFPSRLPFCLSSATAAPATPTATAAPATASVAAAASADAAPQQNGVVKRTFSPYGTAAYNFILMSAYRGGPNSFFIVGLSSTPLHRFSRPTYECEYHPHGGAAAPSTTRGYKIKFPDWGYSRVYTVLVINCTFPNATVGVDGGGDGGGGRLLFRAFTNGGFDTVVNHSDTMEALVEKPGTVNLTEYTAVPEYEYLYCGSSLFGKLSPQRVREWMAYHVRLFGKRSHFVLHDAGGVHPEVMEVLRPWMELGFITLQDIREQERYDGYYHNQFLVLNDCLHRYRFKTKWMFFFDVDEYIYVPKKMSLESVMKEVQDYSQFTIEQMPMSSKLCLPQDARNAPKKWGFEKLVYRDIQKIRRDRKYAIRPRDVFAAGVHMTMNLRGETLHKTEHLFRYFHYHGSISERREPCRVFVNSTYTTVENIRYVLDTSLRWMAPLVKQFELDTIGPVLQRTRQ